MDSLETTQGKYFSGLGAVSPAHLHAAIRNGTLEYEAIHTSRMHPTTPIIGTADLQRRAKAVLAQVRRTRRPHLICTRNRPEALFLDIATYERMERALHHLREERRIAEKVRRAERDVAAGRVHRGDLGTLLRRHR